MKDVAMFTVRIFVSANCSLPVRELIVVDEHRLNFSPRSAFIASSLYFRPVMCVWNRATEKHKIYGEELSTFSVIYVMLRVGYEGEKQ